MRLPEFTEAEVAEATGQLPPSPPPPPSCSVGAIGEAASDAAEDSGCGDITAAVASLSELGRFNDTTALPPTASPEAAAVAAPQGDITAGVALLAENVAEAPAPDQTGQAGAASDPMAPAETGVVDPAGIEAAAAGPRQQGGWDLTDDMLLCSNAVTASMAYNDTEAADTSGESLEYSCLRSLCGQAAAQLAEDVLVSRRKNFALLSA